ncbi:MAG: hypothetical protein A3F13_07600 [Gammaproteobacteria bacterium RIFCSPHIGHO2_12_FULL_40_19]|nr:MAG: hypothetical protein A3F13_07600 [Gammaproteobacteria bacterium RIFCSPHIGHO2_12_FULL_40_19]
MKPLRPILAHILPYLMIAFITVIFMVSIFIFSYLFMIMVLIGFILFITGYIRAKFFNKGKKNSFEEQLLIIQRQMQGTNNPSQKESSKPVHPPHEKSTGRIIEHEDEKKS